MPRDVAFPFEYDETGDVATVEGQAFYEQHAEILGLIAIDRESGGPLTANEIAETETRLADLFRESPYFDEATQVRVTDVDGIAESLSLRVIVPSVTEFEITVGSTSAGGANG